MSAATTNYGLTKPAENEYYDIEIQNANMDKIDTAMKENADAMLKKDGSIQMTGVLKTVGGSAVGSKQIQLNATNCILSDEGGSTRITQNCYFDGTNWKRIVQGKAGLIAIYSDGDPIVLRADEGDIDSIITWIYQGTVLTNLTGLPLTGGTLSGDCHVTKNTPTLRLINSTGHVGYLQCQEDNVTTLGTDNSSGTDAVLVWLTPWAEQAKKIMLGIQTNGTWVGHPLYGTHNITVSTTAPSSALGEGAQHQVY